MLCCAQQRRCNGGRVLARLVALVLMASDAPRQLELKNPRPHFAQMRVLMKAADPGNSALGGPRF
eukprot:6292488-Amphidinium_carterae.1